MNQLFIEKAEKRSLKSVTYPRSLITETNKKKLTKALLVEAPEAKLTSDEAPPVQPLKNHYPVVIQKNIQKPNHNRASRHRSFFRLFN